MSQKQVTLHTRKNRFGGPCNRYSRWKTSSRRNLDSSQAIRTKNRLPGTAAAAATAVAATADRYCSDTDTISEYESIATPEYTVSTTSDNQAVVTTSIPSPSTDITIGGHGDWPHHQLGIELDDFNNVFYTSLGPAHSVTALRNSRLAATQFLPLTLTTCNATGNPILARRTHDRVQRHRVYGHRPSVSIDGSSFQTPQLCTYFADSYPNSGTLDILCR